MPNLTQKQKPVPNQPPPPRRGWLAEWKIRFLALQGHSVSLAPESVCTTDPRERKTTNSFIAAHTLTKWRREEAGVLFRVEFVDPGKHV
jgi:hypothetical protein